MSTPVGRFAPSPTGRMHLGNVYCALMSWLSVKSKGGKWVLRIEDLDRERSRKEFADLIEDDLRWLGLDWDEGGSAGGLNGPYYQSLRDDIYKKYFNRLSEQGLVYPCFCKRADLLAASAPHASDGRAIYAGTCRGLSPEEVVSKMQESAPSWRLKVGSQTVSFTDLAAGETSLDLATEVGDFVIRRANGTFAYQLAVVVDDALMGVTEVVRGNDLLSSASQQIFLYDLLGLKAPSFAHIPLMCAPDGRRLCKRDKSLEMSELRAAYTPEEIIGKIAHISGMRPSDAPCSARDLLEDFDISRLSLSKEIIVDI